MHGVDGSVGPGRARRTESQGGSQEVAGAGCLPLTGGRSVFLPWAGSHPERPPHHSTAIAGLLLGSVPHVVTRWRWGPLPQSLEASAMRTILVCRQANGRPVTVPLPGRSASEAGRWDLNPCPTIFQSWVHSIEMLTPTAACSKDGHPRLPLCPHHPSHAGWADFARNVDISRGNWLLWLSVPTASRNTAQCLQGHQEIRQLGSQCLLRRPGC